jgi:hypothetical protein
MTITNKISCYNSQLSFPYVFNLTAKIELLLNPKEAILLTLIKRPENKPNIKFSSALIRRKKIMI